MSMTEKTASDYIKKHKKLKKFIKYKLQRCADYPTALNNKNLVKESLKEILKEIEKYIYE